MSLIEEMGSSELQGRSGYKSRCLPLFAFHSCQIPLIGHDVFLLACAEHSTTMELRSRRNSMITDAPRIEEPEEEDPQEDVSSISTTRGQLGSPISSRTRRYVHFALMYPMITKSNSLLSLATLVVIANKQLSRQSWKIFLLLNPVSTPVIID